MNFIESNEIYKKLTDTEIQLYNFNGLDIPFNPKWKRIGVNLSGGADSSCLLALLGNIISKNNINCEVHIITHIRCWNTRPWQAPIALDVYTKFLQLFPSIKFVRHTNYIPPELEWGAIGPITLDEERRPRSGDQICVGSFNNYITTKEQLDAVYNATSQNPIGKNFPGGMENRNKLAADGVLKDLILQKDDFCVCHPFRFVEKSWIVSQYKIMGLMDLYNTTRSCEGNITHPNISKQVKKYKFGDYVPLCGECFWCLERSWAEEQNE